MRIFEEKDIFECLNSEEIPRGWRIRFVDPLGNDILGVLKKHNIQLDKFHIMQVKEKYGELRVYYTADDGDGDFFNDMDDAIEKYTMLSHTICMACGANID